jgi:linoleoyl-CoA desaturase
MVIISERFLMGLARDKACLVSSSSIQKFNIKFLNSNIKLKMIKNKIKFSAQIKPDFINELREKVKNYFETNQISKYGNTEMILKSIFMVSLYFIPYILMISGIFSSPALVLVCWIIMGIGMAGVGMGVMHDANHGTYSKNKKINSIVGKSIYLIGGYPPNWKFQHNTLHHAYTNIDGHDEDISSISLLRLSPHKPLFKVHKIQNWYAWFFYGLMTLFWATGKDFMQLLRYKEAGTAFTGNKSYLTMLFHMILGKIVYYAIFLFVPLITVNIAWYWIVAGFLVMHFTTGVILGTVFQTAHVVTNSNYPLPDENGKIENNWAIHQLSTTTNFSPKSRILSWLLGGLNYQVEHHLFPNISHVHYRKISKFVKETAQKYGLPYHVQQSFFSAIGNHARMLKILGNNAYLSN